MSNSDKKDNPIVIKNAKNEQIGIRINLRPTEGSNSPSKIVENIVWNPTQPMPNDSEIFFNWMVEHRDYEGKIDNVEVGQKIVAIQEANMGGEYWRLLWPKDANNLMGMTL